MARNDQKQRIKMLQKRLGMNDAAYHDFLAQFKAASCTELSISQADEAIKLLADAAVKKGIWQNYGGRRRYEHLDGRPADFATSKQLRMIAGMWADVSFQKSAPKRERALNRFLQNHFGIMGMEQVMRSDVERIVRALQAMKWQKEQRQMTNDK